MALTGCGRSDDSASLRPHALIKGKPVSATPMPRISTRSPAPDYALGSIGLPKGKIYAVMIYALQGQQTACLAQTQYSSTATTLEQTSRQTQ